MQQLHFGSLMLFWHCYEGIRLQKFLLFNHSHVLSGCFLSFVPVQFVLSWRIFVNIGWLCFIPSTKPALHLLLQVALASLFRSDPLSAFSCVKVSWKLLFLLQVVFLLWEMLYCWDDCLFLNYFDCRYLNTSEFLSVWRASPNCSFHFPLLEWPFLGMNSTLVLIARKLLEYSVHWPLLNGLGVKIGFG